MRVSEKVDYVKLKDLENHSSGGSEVASYEDVECLKLRVWWDYSSWE